MFFKMIIIGVDIIMPNIPKKCPNIIIPINIIIEFNFTFLLTKIGCIILFSKSCTTTIIINILIP